MSELKPLREIINEYLIKLKDPAFHEAMRSREAAFRRGYHHGWDNAIEEIFSLWQHGMSEQEAYALCALYVNGVANWRADTHHDSSFILPPAFDLDVLQKALALYRARRKEEI